MSGLNQVQKTLVKARIRALVASKVGGANPEAADTNIEATNALASMFAMVRPYELRQIISWLPQGEDLLLLLPEEGSSTPASLNAAVAKLLIEKGLVTRRELWEIFCEKRPLRTSEIAALALQFGLTL